MIRDPDSLRVVWLFGKPYSWERLPDGRLTLQGAAWNAPLFRAEMEEIRSRWLEMYGKPDNAHQVKPLDEENPDA